MKIADELKRLIDDVLCDDPQIALAALRRLSDDELPWIEQKVVAMARCKGWNWSKIGRMLRRDRTSVRNRFDHVRLAVRHPEPTFSTAIERDFRESIAEHDRRRRYEADDEPMAW